MLLSSQNIDIETIIEIKAALPSCGEVGSWAAIVMAADLAIFAAMWWIWERQITKHDGLVTFTLFMVVFILSGAGAVSAALGSSCCRIIFSLACLGHIPFVLAVWLVLRIHAKDAGRLESKIRNTEK